MSLKEWYDVKTGNYKCDQCKSWVEQKIILHGKCEDCREAENRLRKIWKARAEDRQRKAIAFFEKLSKKFSGTGG